MLTVHVALQEEGTTVWRPVDALHIKGSIYQLVGLVPDQEQWQFMPGQIVECQERTTADGNIFLLACRLAEQ